MTSNRDNFVSLKEAEPLAKGRMRLVFRHPHDASLLIKVIRPDIIGQRWGEGAPWYKKRRRYGLYISYIREVDEYIAAYASHGKPLSFAQKITGFVETDFGLGLVMEAALDEKGNLAPTVSELINTRRFDDAASQLLEHFIDAVVASDLIIADFNLNNIVLAHDRVLGNQFVLIDGLGLSTIMPFKLVSHAFNRWSKRGRVKRLRNRMERTRKNVPTDLDPA